MLLRVMLGVFLAILVFAPYTLAQGPVASVGAADDTAASIRPGDLVRLRIWREPDYSGEFPVDETGVVVFPRIGPVKVIEESPESLKAKLISEYEQYLTHSSIEVTLLRRVQILGAVRNPGLYPMDATMTIEDGLALAGGITPEGNPDRLQLSRGGERLPIRLSRRTKLSDSPVRSGDQIYVPERRWISRNPAVFGAAITAAVSLIIAFTF